MNQALILATGTTKDCKAYLGWAQTLMINRIRTDKEGKANPTEGY